MRNTTAVIVHVPAELENCPDKLADATIRKGKRDVQAGRIVSHEKTVRWLRSWGKKRELPPPLRE